MLASDGQVLTGLWFDGQKRLGGAQYYGHEERGLSVFSQACRWLDIYFDGKEPGFLPMMRMQSTGFRIAVWRALLRIPFGHTATYGEIAEEVAEVRGIPRMSARAVGGAVGRNPLAIIVPCHRVVGSNGWLGGYAAGIGIKRSLLAMEGVDVDVFHAY